MLVHALLPEEHAWSSDEDVVLLDDGKAEANARRRRRRCLRACGVCTLLAAVTAALLAVFYVPAVIESSLKTAELDLGIVNLTDPTSSSVSLSCDATMTLKDAPLLGATIRAPRLKFRVRSADGSGWVTAGVLTLPRIAAGAGEKRFSLSVRGAPLSVTALDGWTSFTRSVVNAAEVRWRLEGQVDVAVDLLGSSSSSFLPPLVYKGVALAVNSASGGMNGFTSPFPFIETYDAFSGSLEAYPTQVAGCPL